MSSVIEIENLSKKYVIQHEASRGAVSFREEISNYFQGWGRSFFHPLSRVRSSKPLSREEFWALRNITLEVKQGERVGIIGRNGAGKTTLLKVLSRITEPTEGQVTIAGRVASLLEVGTGFHPELTGRENIYLNGAILGMSRAEIKQKFDEIVDFAEIEKFLDTPVKRYSSGMYVRLAFAVAAHLEPEILLVDEVLAVGDIGFQKKCLGKMEGVSNSGRTILFVSHQMGHIAALCSRCLLLKNGNLVLDGPTQQVIAAYLESLRETQVTSLRERKDRQGTGQIRVIDTWIEDAQANRVEHLFSGSQIKLVLKYELMGRDKPNNVLFGFGIHSSQGVWITELGNQSIKKPLHVYSKIGRVECIIPKLGLNNGTYTCNVMVRSGNSGQEIFDYIQDVLTFTVEPGDYFGSGFISRGQNMMVMDHDWRVTGD